MAVTLGRTTLLGVEPGADTSTEMAIALAKELRAKGVHEFVTHAVVDRSDGLAVYRGDPDTSLEPGERLARGWHFAAPTCGYEGTGSLAAAEILEMFGFGDRRNLYELIRHGEDHAYYHFHKGVGLVDSGR